MLWYLPWSESIKKRACRYLLQRYLGNFLEEKLTLDQLSVDLYNGTGTVSDVSLDCEALNELGDAQNWPLQIVDGHMKEITVTIPWSTLLKDDSIVEVNGLTLAVQPKVRAEPVSSMLESMWSSMSSSMQLAAECLREEDGPHDSHAVEGIEMFAHAIDSILSRVKVKFINTKIRIEHVPKNGDRGIALEIHIKHIDYFDEAGSEPTPDVTDPEKSKTYVVSTYTSKKIKLEGVSFYTDEFPSKLRTMARSLVMEKSSSSQADKSDPSPEDVITSTMSDVFYETRSVISTIEPDPVKEIIAEAKSRAESRDLTPDEKANQPDPILFARITGQQELSIKIKHSEEVEGPKVEIRVLFGSFIVFISPRQLHTLIELIDALNQPDLEDTSNIPLRPSGMNVCKPMRQADFQLIEAQLLGNLETQAPRHTAKYGWSGPGFEDSDMESERFLPMSSAGGMSESYSSSVSSMSASMASSVNLPTAQPRAKRNKKVPHIDGDPTAEVSHVSLRISSISCVLLHKDILIGSPIKSDCITPLSATRMREASAQFFETLGPYHMDELNVFTEVNESLDNAARRNHIRLLTSDITLDGSEKVTSHGSQTVCEAAIRHLLVRECLYNHGSVRPESFDLVRFENKAEEEDDSSSRRGSTTTSRANVRVNFKQTSKFVRVGGEKKLVYPTTDIVVKCTPFFLDVELTLIERMSATFFGGSPSSAAPAPPAPLQAQHQLNLSLQCSNLSAVLRFPIADLRPGVNRETRRVRSDYLVFKFANATISCQQTPSARPMPTTVTLKATALDLFYHENDELPPTHIAQSSMDNTTADGNILSGHIPSTHLPTISITFKPRASNKSPFDSITDERCFEHTTNNPMTTSLYIMNNLKSSQPSPFSGKKCAHQSVTKHESSPQQNTVQNLIAVSLRIPQLPNLATSMSIMNNLESSQPSLFSGKKYTPHRVTKHESSLQQSQDEDIIVPGNEEEMSEFTSSSVELSSIHLEFSLPILSLQLESKQIYEIIYNRINSDLLLWEPQIADPFEISPLACAPIHPAFGACKPQGYDSDSDSTSSEEENLYYSTYDNRNKKSYNAKAVQEKVDTHNFCLTLKVGKGLLTIYAPVRDSNKRVVPGQMGELVLEAHKLSMCQVSGLNGRPKTAQLCLRAGRVTLYHDSLITIPSDKPALRLYGTILPINLKNTIYPSGKGVIVKERIAQKDMFTMALKVDPDSETPNLKTICIALGIEQASLRHRGEQGVAWLSQLMDVLDVLDYPVPGYSPATVLSQLHVHVLDCSVDYRPLYLPIRTVLTLGNFSVSSNLIAATNTSCLRFLAQECMLFLYHLPTTKTTAVPQDDDKNPDVNRDYVCVMDLGLFELSLRMEDKGNGPNDQPQVDLSASNNMVNVYTCWDSASALCRLVTYVASDGDSQAPFDPSSRHTSICSDQPIEPLVGLEDKPIEEIRELSPSEIQQVNDLMAEAMKESPNTTLDEEELHSSTEKEGVEIFFFPDESNIKRLSDAVDEDAKSIKSVDFDDPNSMMTSMYVKQDEEKVNAQVAKDLGDPTASPKSTPKKAKRKKVKSGGDGSTTDDEYCFVDTQPHTLDSEMDEPVVNWLGPTPVYMCDNHFTVPAARSDVLKAPKSFPLPQLRYTLCEMSVTWNMYGGTDFRPVTDAAPKKTVTIDDARKQGSPTTVKRNKEYEPYESGRALTAAYRSGVSWSAGSERVRAAGRGATRSLRTRGGPHRDHHTRVKLCLSKVKFQYEIYPAGGIHASRQTLAISKIEVIDLLLVSDINKLLSQYKLKDEPERQNAHMLIVKAVHMRPEPALSAQECCLKVSLLPLWFNLDQDTLAFLVGYFSKLGTDDATEDDTKSVSGLSTESSSSRQTTPTHRPPVMSIASHLKDPPPTPTSLGDADSLSLNETVIREDEPLMETYEAERLVSENLIQLEEDFNKLGLSNEKPAAKLPVDEPVDDSPIYFRRVVFSPEVAIRLDYVGKRVELSAGPVAGLLMGLGQLNCSELTLKRLDYKLGLLGLEKLLQWALHEWLSDIKRHQLPGLLSGIGPMHSLLQLITGIRDLVWLPVEQWRRDGRLVHGIKRGAASFTARTAVAALDITTRLLQLIQATAETAFDMLTPGPTLQLQDAYNRRERRRRRRQDPSRHPTDIREGVASAYQTVREGFADQAATMALAARCESGVGVLRHLPGAAVAPLALAAAGAADVLGGVRAHLAPDTSRDRKDKWRRHARDATDSTLD